jgi:hypothetical protein
VVSCPPRLSLDAGYATPVALVFALCVSVLSIAIVGRSLMLLRVARADLERTQVAYGLDGAQLLAAASVIRSGEGGPYRWALSIDLGWTQVVAEPEDDKLSLEAAGALPDDALRAFGVTDIAEFRARLQAGATHDLVDIEALDRAPLWRACSASLISSFGLRSRFVWRSPQEPRRAHDQPARHPVAVVARRLSRGKGGHERCDDILRRIAV